MVNKAHLREQLLPTFLNSNTITYFVHENLITFQDFHVNKYSSIYLILSFLIPKISIMENSNQYNSGNFHKCPYQSQVYGTNKSELIYRKVYKGDWGDWDDMPQNIPDENAPDQEVDNNLEFQTV